MSRENVTNDRTNEQTDAVYAPDIEAEYLALLGGETPDLWAKIEEGLDICDAEKKKRSRRKYVPVIAGIAAAAAVAAVLMVSQMMPTGRTKENVSDRESDSAVYNQAEMADTYDDALPETAEISADNEQAEGEVSYDDAAKTAEIPADNEQAEGDVSYDDAAVTNEITADNAQTDSDEAVPLVSGARLTVQETDKADGGFICAVTVTEIPENNYGIQAGDEIRIICDTSLETGTDISCDIAAFDEELNAYVIINKYFP